MAIFLRPPQNRRSYIAFWGNAVIPAIVLRQSLLACSFAIEQIRSTNSFVSASSNVSGN
jgi:hypothetical protein